jgi:signal transduction histidine kinase
VRLQLASADERPVERISIQDAGIGMDAETRRRAGEQFYRSDEARSFAPNGSGIGLYTSRALMELMGGSLELSGELGRGTTVVLTIPAEPVGDDSVGAANERPTPISTSGNRAQG